MKIGVTSLKRRVFVLGAILALFSGTAQGQVSNWYGPYGGTINSNNPYTWAENTTPTGGATTTLNWGLFDQLNYSVNNNITGLTVNALTFNGSGPVGGNALTISGNAITLDGSAGGTATISNNTSGNVTISAPMTFAAANPNLSLIFNGTGAGTTTISGAITGTATNNMTINTNRHATTSITGDNSSFLGTTTLAQGVLNIGNVNALGATAANTITIGGQSTILSTNFNFNGSFASPAPPPIFPAVVNNNIAVGAGNQLRLLAAGLTAITDTTLPTTTTISNTVTRYGGLVSGGGGVAVLAGPVELINPLNSYSGQTVVQGGSLRVSISVPGAGAGILGTPGSGNETIQLGRNYGSGGSGTAFGVQNLFNGAELGISSAAATSFNRPINANAGPLRVGIAAIAAAPTSFGGAITTNNRLTLVANGGTAMTLGGPVGGAGSLEFISGTTILSNAGNSYSGGTYISGGIASSTSNSGFGTGTIHSATRGGGISANAGAIAINNAINLGGMIYQIDTGGTSILPFQFAGTNAITMNGQVFGSGAISIPQGATITFGNLQNSIGVLVGGLATSRLEIGTGTLNLFATQLAATNQNSLYSGLLSGGLDASVNKYGINLGQEFSNLVDIGGPLNNFGGNISFSGALGALENSTSYNGSVSGAGANGNSPSGLASSRLTLDYTSGQADRLQSNFAVNLKGGTFAMTGNAAAAVTEAAGNLTLSGYGFATLTTNGFGVTASFGNLVRTPGQGGTLLVRGGTGTITDLGVPGFSRVTFTSAPQLTGVAGTNPGETPFLPYVLADTVNTGNGNTFATYTSGTLTPIPLASYATYDVAGPNSNVRVTAALDPQAGKTIQSLILDSSNLPGYSFGGSGTLTINPTLGSQLISAVLVSGTIGAAINGFTSLDFGGKEGIFYVTGATNIVQLNVPISGVNATAGFVKAGGGVLFPTAASTFITTEIVAAGGALNITNNNQLGDSSNKVLLNGGSLMWNVGAPGVVAFPRTLSVGEAGGGLNVVAGNSLTLTGLSGNGAFIKGGAGTLALTGAGTNIHTGRTVIAAGVLEVSGDNVLGTSPMVAFEGTFGATLRVTGPSFGKDVAVLNHGLIDIPAASTTFTGQVFGGNSSSITNATTPNVNTTLAKIGAGTMVLNSSQPFGGPLAILQGNVTLTANGALPSSFGTPLMSVFDGSPSAGSNGTYVAFGSSLTLDNAGTNINDRLLDYQSVRLHNGSLNLTGNNAADSYETLNALLLQAGSFNTVTVTPGTGRHASFGFSTVSPVTGQSTGGIASAGAVLFRGTNLGQIPGAVAGASTAGVVFTDSSSASYSRPSLFLVGGGGGPGTTNISILPFAIGDISATGNGSGFVTLDGPSSNNTGIRPLADAEYATAIASTAGSATFSSNNVRLTAPAAINGPAQINSLVVAAAGAGTTGSGSLTLNAGAVLSTGGFANAGLNNGVLQFGSNPAYFFVNDNLAVGATILGHNPSTPNAFSLLKAGPGVLTLSAPNAFGLATSGVSVASGTLRVNADNALNPVAPVNVLNGGTLEVDRPVLNIGNLTASVPATFTFNAYGGGTVSLNGNTLNVGLANANAIFAGVISGSGNLARPVFAQTANTSFLIGSNTYTGSTTIVSGGITLQGPSSSLAATSGVNVAGGNFTINNADVNGFNGMLNNTRIPETADFRLAGTLAFTGNTNGNSSQSFGLNANGAIFQGGSTITVVAGTWANAAITLGLGAGGMINRSNNATALIRGTSLGTSLFGVAPLATTPVNPGSGPQVANIFFNGVPSAANFIGGGGAVGTTTMSIIPWAVGDPNLAGSGNSFLTYTTPPSTGVGGLRPLNFNQNLGAVEYASAITAGSVSLNNVRITDPELVLGTSGQVASTVNSLILAGGTLVRTDSGTATLTIASGALLSTTGATITSAITLNNLTQESVIHPTLGTTLTFNGSIAGTGGLTKGGAGTLVLNPALPAQNTYTGRTTITAGTISFSATPSAGADVFGADPLNNNLVFAGAFAGPTLLYTGAANGEIGRAINLAVGSGTVNVATAATELTLSRVVSGSGTFIKAGAGTVILENALNSYTGGTRVDAGVLRFSSDARLGGSSGPMILAGGNLELTGVWTSSRDIYFNAASTWTLNGNNATLSGTIAGVSTGVLTVNSTAPAALELGGHNTSNMALVIGSNVRVRVTSGTALGLASQNVTVSAGATLELANGIFLGQKPIILNGAGIAGGALFNSSGNNSSQGTVNLDTSSSISVVAGTTLSLYGNLTGTGAAALTKTGGGVLNLANPAGNGFTGAFDITAGSIRVANTTGNATGSGIVSINSGGTLTGKGSVNAILLNSGGTIAPGDSPGILNVTSSGTTGSPAPLAFGAGPSAGNFAFEINNATGTAGVNWDVLRVINNSGAPIALPGSVGMNILISSMGSNAANFDPTQTYTWSFLQSSGGFTNFASTVFNINSTGFTNPLGTGVFSVVNVNGGLELAVQFSPVPEPAEVLLMGAAVFGLVGLHRRRRMVASI